MPPNEYDVPSPLAPIPSHLNTIATLLPPPHHHSLPTTTAEITKKVDFTAILPVEITTMIFDHVFDGKPASENRSLLHLSKTWHAQAKWSYWRCSTFALTTGGMKGMLLDLPANKRALVRNVSFACSPTPSTVVDDPSTLDDRQRLRLRHAMHSGSSNLPRDVPLLLDAFPNLQTLRLTGVDRLSGPGPRGRLPPKPETIAAMPWVTVLVNRRQLTTFSAVWREAEQPTSSTNARTLQDVVGILLVARKYADGIMAWKEDKELFLRDFGGAVGSRMMWNLACLLKAEGCGEGFEMWAREATVCGQRERVVRRAREWEEHREWHRMLGQVCEVGGRGCGEFRARSDGIEP